MQKLNLKKIFLQTLIGSVSVSALFGIVAILIGDFGEFESRILATTLTITCTSILGLACGVNLERNPGGYVPILGIIFSIVSAISAIIIIWAEPTGGYFFGRFFMSVTILAVAFSLLSLVTLAWLDARFKWALTALYIFVVALVLLLFGLIWGRDWYESELVMRGLGVLAIAVASLTVMIPVFHKLSDHLDKTDAIDAEIEKLKTRIAELEKRKNSLSN